MAICAEKIIKANGFDKMIKLIHKPSTTLTVGENGDLKKRANILVAEVFDTELIGEGALSTFHHASQVLLEVCIAALFFEKIHRKVPIFF